MTRRKDPLQKLRQYTGGIPVGEQGGEEMAGGAGGVGEVADPTKSQSATFMDRQDRTAEPVALGQGFGSGMAANPAGFLNWGAFLGAQTSVPNRGTGPSTGGQFGTNWDGKSDVKNLGPGGVVGGGGEGTTGRTTASNVASVGVGGDLSNQQIGYMPGGGYSSGMANIDAMLSGAQAAGQVANPVAPNGSRAGMTPTGVSGTPPVRAPQVKAAQGAGFAGLRPYMGRGM